MEVDLRPALATTVADDDALLETIRRAVYNKPEGHHFSRDFVSERKMNRIGG
jgi:molybdenum cofactor biosynthesis enzyme MoaA